MELRHKIARRLDAALLANGDYSPGFGDRLRVADAILELPEIKEALELTASLRETHPPVNLGTPPAP